MTESAPVGIDENGRLPFEAREALAADLSDPETEVGAAVAGAVGTLSDPAVASLIDDTESATNASLSATFASREIASFNAGVGTPRAPFHNRSMLTPDLAGTDDFVGHIFGARVEGDFTGVPATNPGWVFGTNMFTNTGTGADDGKGLTQLMNLAEVSIRGGGFTGVATGFMAEAAFLGGSAAGKASSIISMKVAAPKRKDGATGGEANRVYGLWVDEVPDNVGYLGSIEAYSLFVEGGLSYFSGRAIFAQNVAVAGELRADTITSRTDSTRKIIWGAGTPEGVVSAGVGSMYFNTLASEPGYAQWVKEGGSSGTTGWRNRGTVVGALASKFGSSAGFVNTTGKYAGRQGFETTNNRPIWATGSGATAPWAYADGTVAVTPS